MKHKRLDRNLWGFSHFPYYQMRVDTDDFHGLACIIRITGGEYQYWQTPKAGRLAVCGEGMTWMELIPDDKKRVITVKYFRDGTNDEQRSNYPDFVDNEYRASLWYVDVIDGIEFDEDGTAIYIDKYLDVIFTPEGDIVVDDRDELDNAYASGELSDEQYNEAIAESEEILKEMTSDIAGTEARCARIRRYIEDQILEQTKASIYHPFVRGYFADNEEILKQHGYKYTPEKDHRVMVLKAANEIESKHSIEIKALNEWDERVATDILIPSGEPWEVEVTKRRVKNEGAYLFVGYLDDKAVVYSDIHISDNNNVRFDYIVTAKEHRGKGYASELLDYIVEFCKKRGLPNCWQWVGPSEHICYRAGFREIFTMEAGYAGIE